MARALSNKGYRDAVPLLAARDPDLAAIVHRIGIPQRVIRPPGFSSLCYIVLEQQVSLASARACFNKLEEALPSFAPESLLNLSDAELRELGVSRQKARYMKLIAEALLDGSLPLDRLGRMDDESARTQLTRITGIGNWTADVYLMSALRRPDLWPIGDLALVKALVEIKELRARPEREQLMSLGEAYRPFRSVATHLYWHHYLNPP